ncbi:ABC transporter, putative [Bodo saltans]|uniref:ABC transporter, putative n=1 Tax=Bodo saltans TaxID=75058 RepID=A0A0S4KM38_BODSA|nr:ABC transporter, putative [Bodo saltans]|eukprot:CUM57954.1 ABC transporter, putative [Bodo saltans]
MQTAVGASAPVSLAFYNATSWHQLTVSVFDYYNAIYRRTAGAGSFMRLVNNPMPKTSREEAFADSIKSIIIGIIIMIPFTFIPSTFVSWVVKERECKARHLQNVSGLKFSVYWLSNFMFDMASFTVTVILTLIVFAIFSRSEYIGSSSIGATIVLFLFYGLSGVGFSYAISFFFNEHSTAQNVVMLANFITGFLLVLVVFILSVNDSTENASKYLAFIFRVIPSYCLGDGIINLALHELQQSVSSASSAWDLDVVGWDIIDMAIEFPILLAVTFFIDHPGRRMKTQKMLHDANKANPENLDGEDIDVRRERESVADATANGRENDLVLVRNLRKQYPNGKVAVRNLSFGVHPGEVFGFLGTNGAGKTTAISILCQEFFPTSGHASIAGFDIVDNATEALRCIGYCPQFDALLDLLTVQEHLELYAGVRGIEPKDRHQVVVNLAALCELTTYMTTQAKQLSGGNKRKLSVALSLIGGPRVVFLDEPSAGMDPVARRGLWTAISNIAGNCSVVLTTHHLEEVEALAHRVAIMVDGSLHCIGTKLHLKQKYGSGFEMDVRLQGRPRGRGANGSNDVEANELERQATEFLRFLSTELPSATINERRGNRFNIALPQNTLLSVTFRLLESHKERLRITDYSVSQTSIEQVFLRISMEAELSSVSPQHHDASLTPQAM